MSGVNKVIVIGNVGQDPQINAMPNGGSVANLSVATSEKWKDQQGQMQERTEWHRVVFFGKLADVIAQYVHKGSKLYVEGRLQTREWQDQQGQKRYTTEIIGRELQMLDSRTQGQPKSQQPAQNARQSPDSGQNYAPQEPGMDFDDDIPF